MNIKHVFQKFLIEYANFAFPSPIFDIEYAWIHCHSMILMFIHLLFFSLLVVQPSVLSYSFQQLCNLFSRYCVSLGVSSLKERNIIMIFTEQG